MIVMSEDQLAYVEKEWALMEPWTDQVVDHNREYHKHCVKEEK